MSDERTVPSGEEPRIREATPADAEALAELAARTFSDTYLADNEPGQVELYVATHFGPELQRAELRDRATLTLVAERVENGSASGARQPALLAYAQLRASSETPAAVVAARPVELARFYVDRAWHGRGLARRLMDACTAAARVLGSDMVWLGVWQRNARAVAFYQKCGFRVAGEVTFTMGDDVQRDQLMVKTLADSTR